MKTIAFLDCETSDLSPDKGSLLEVAVALWSVEHRSLIEAHSWLGDADENAAEAVNGIAPALTKARGLAREDIAIRLRAVGTRVDAVVAYNSDFDRQWCPELHALPWLDAMDDFDYPRASGGKKLVEVALAHGVGVVHAHRAMSDVMTMVALFERIALDFDRLDQGRAEGGEATEMPGTFGAWLRRAARPHALFKALVSYDEKDKAKELGFHWRDDKHPTTPKSWVKRLAVEDAGKLPFRVQQVRA